VYTKLSKLMTLFGLAVMGFYAIMLSSGKFSLEVMPQFATAAVMFLSSGRIMKKIAQRINFTHQKQRRDNQPHLDWQLLIWISGITLLMLLSLLILIPFGVSIQDTYLLRLTHQLSINGWTP